MGTVHLPEAVATEGTEDTEKGNDAQPEPQGDVADLPALQATYRRGKGEWRVIALRRAARPPRGFMAPC